MYTVWKYNSHATYTFKTLKLVIWACCNVLDKKLGFAAKRVLILCFVQQWHQILVLCAISSKLYIYHLVSASPLPHKLLYCLPNCGSWRGFGLDRHMLRRNSLKTIGSSWTCDCSLCDRNGMMPIGYLIAPLELSVFALFWFSFSLNYL